MSPFPYPIAENRAVYGHGGAIFDQDSQVTLKNCIPWNNTRMRDPDGRGPVAPTPAQTQ